MRAEVIRRERKGQREGEGHGHGGVKRGQHKRLLLLVLNWSRGWGGSAMINVRVASVCNGEQISSAETHLVQCLSSS